jgi:transposase-like protein
LLEIGQKHQIAPSLIHKWKEEFFEKAHTVFESNKENQEQDRKMKHYEHVIAKITTQNDFLEKVLAVTR